MKLRKIFSQLVLFSLLLVCCSVSAQTNISGIINSYAKVTNISGNQFTINNPAGRSGATLNDFNSGARVLIYQAKGASITTSNTSSFGQITNLGNAGRYEIAIVESRSGNTITFSNVSNTYDVNGLVQVVSIPVYDHVRNTGELTATDWNKNNGYGGIVILQANTFTLGANINLDGKGFEGGNRSSNNGNGCVSIYSSSNSIYGEKGEGITTYSSNLRGQGALANGGGGGSTHNGGAGGGSNHARGGNGGKGWGCGSSNNAGGRGGYGLTYDVNSARIFFGGGGGGGQQNNSVGSSGGDGGGVVILLVHTLTTNCNSNYTISARGISAGDAGNDGAGGAGAGGVIVINTSVYDAGSCQINLNVDGGNGGDVNTPNSHGGGGGGGSGVILSSIDLPSGVNESGTSGTNGNDSYTAPPSGTPSEEKPVDKVVNPVIPGANPVVGPGGHIQGLQLWLNSQQDYLYSDTGLSSTVGSNGQVRGWRNIANPDNNILAQNSNTGASFRDGTADQLNYHPVVRMSNVNLGLRTSDRFDGQSIFVVTKTTTTANLAGLVGFNGDKGIRLESANIWRDSDSNDWHRYGGSGEKYINAQSGLTHNQQWHIVNQEAVSVYNERFYVGGYYSNRSYSGDITEVIVYRDRLDATEQSRVESYLAVKYGITLINKDYLNSDAQVIWDYSGNSTYHNDIAGIGRDHVGELNQIKSKSSNSDAVLTIETEGTIDNKAFLLWGNDNAGLTARSTNTPESVSERIARIWKVDKIGNTGSVKVSFDLSSLGISSPVESDFSLLISTTADFTSATKYETGRSLDTGNQSISFTGVTLSDGNYFTLSTQPTPAPGGETDMEFWLKADAGTSTTSEGASLTQWNDQLNTNHAVQFNSLQVPVYRTANINFNPAVDFSDAARYLTIPDSDDLNTNASVLEKSFSILFRTGDDINSRQVLYEEGGTGRGVNAYIFNGNLYVAGWNTNSSDGVGSGWNFLHEDTPVAANQVYLLTFNMQGTDTKNGKIELILNGEVKQTVNGIGRLYAHGAAIGLGGMVNDSYFESLTNDETGDNYSFDGQIAEISYSKDYLDDTGRNKLESYLALKYGVTLDQTVAKDYVSTAGTTVWSGSSHSNYKNDIAGIARDDNTQLLQNKSKSVHSTAIITIANGGSIASPTSLSSNLSFLIWGHNGQVTNTFSANYYGLSGNGIPRVWRVAESGSVGSVRLQIPKAALPSGVTSLFVSNDVAFPNSSNTQRYDLTDSGSNQEVSVDLQDGNYFTFGRINSTPVLGNIENYGFGYCNGDENVTDDLTVTDSDHDQLTATISIISGFVSGEDALIYSTVAGVTKKASSTDQSIELNAANISDMQTALRSIQYHNTRTGSTRTEGDRVIQFTINDGFADSNQVSRIIHVYLAPAQVGIYHE